MEVETVQLYLSSEDRSSDRGDYWANEQRLANPMSRYPEYERRMSSWAGEASESFAVELVTSDGTSGVAVVSGGGAHACSVIDAEFRQFVEGASPFDIERIWEQMYRSQQTFGQRGIVMQAISAVDVALWDLLGQLTDQPVYNLLGGQTSERVDCYVTTHRDAIEAFVDEGFLGIKLSAPWGPDTGYREGIRKTVEMVADAREMVSDTTELMLDAFMGWDREFTVRVAEQLREYDLKWIEDPLLPQSNAANADIRTEIKPIQLAVGNIEFGSEAFQQLLAAGAGDIIQPEIQWVGGITNARRIAALTRAHDLPLVPHAAGVYAYHFVAAHSVAPYAECLVTGDGTELQPRFDELAGQPLPENGAITLDDAAGFGVELDRTHLVPFDEAKRH